MAHGYVLGPREHLQHHNIIDIIFSYAGSCGHLLWVLGHAEAWWMLILSLSSSYQLGFQRLWWVSQKCQTLPWLLKSPLVCPQLCWGSPRKERRLRRSRRRRSNWVSFGGVVLFRGLVVLLEFNKWLGEPQKNAFPKSASFFPQLQPRPSWAILVASHVALPRVYAQPKNWLSCARSRRPMSKSNRPAFPASLGSLCSVDWELLHVWHGPKGT